MKPKETTDFTWVCPKCGYINEWTWFDVDIPWVGEITTLQCGNCKKDSKMVCKLVEAK